MEWLAFAVVVLAVLVLNLQRKVNALEIQLQRASSHLERATDLLAKIERNTEKTSEYLYAQSSEYRQHLAEIEKVRP